MVSLRKISPTSVHNTFELFCSHTHTRAHTDTIDGFIPCVVGNHNANIVRCKLTVLGNLTAAKLEVLAAARWAAPAIMGKLRKDYIKTSLQKGLEIT